MPPARLSVGAGGLLLALAGLSCCLAGLAEHSPAGVEAWLFWTGAVFYLAGWSLVAYGWPRRGS